MNMSERNTEVGDTYTHRKGKTNSITNISLTNTMMTTNNTGRVEQRATPKEKDTRYYREQAREMAVETFKELLRKSPDDGMIWQSTARDLVELTHEVWLTGQIFNRQGQQMSFKMMVHHIFNILHAREPASPTSILSNLQRRKCMRTLPVLERYGNMLAADSGRNPVLADLGSSMVEAQ